VEAVFTGGNEAAMSHRLFPESALVSYREFDLELLQSGAFRHPDLLDSIRDEVFNVAARARGWNDPEGLATMRAHFKIGPLYEANALALIRRNACLVGLVGSVNNWHLADKSIVHLCSLGLLPSAQKRGFVPTLLGLLWLWSWQDEVLQRNYANRQVYISGITQSPFILGFLHRLFDVYPSPYRAAPDREMVEVAQNVVARFDADLILDPERFILRNECRFFYRRIPYSSDRQINEFCDRNLRYSQGDVFLIVGRVVPEAIETHIAWVNAQYPELFDALRPVSELRTSLPSSPTPIYPSLSRAVADTG
jgi:hypothetical protein